MDVMMLPRAWDGAEYYKACLIIDVLTKYVYVHPVKQCSDKYAESHAMVGALLAFVNEVRKVAEDHSLHPKIIITDKASTFTGTIFSAHIAKMASEVPGHYSHKCIPGTKSQANPAERAIQTYRRMVFAAYDAHMAEKRRSQQQNRQRNDEAAYFTRANRAVFDEEAVAAANHLENARTSVDQERGNMARIGEHKESSVDRADINKSPLELYDNYAAHEAALATALRSERALSGNFVWPREVGRISAFLNEKPHYGLNMATPHDALDPNSLPTYTQIRDMQKLRAERNYGARKADPPIRGHAPGGPLKIGQHVRLKMWHDGGGVNSLSWKTPNNTARNVYDMNKIYDICEVIKPKKYDVFSGYVIKDTASGERVNGVFDVCQLLPIPKETLQLSDATIIEDEDGAEPEVGVSGNENTQQRTLRENSMTHPRSGVNRPRYRLGDWLGFDAEYVQECQELRNKHLGVRSVIGVIVRRYAPRTAKLPLAVSPLTPLEYAYRIQLCPNQTNGTLIVFHATTHNSGSTGIDESPYIHWHENGSCHPGLRRSARFSMPRGQLSPVFRSGESVTYRNIVVVITGVHGKNEAHTYSIRAPNGEVHRNVEPWEVIPCKAK